MSQKIKGNSNIQVAGDYITTNKIVNKTEAVPNANIHITEAQAFEINERVSKIVKSLSGEKRFDKPPYGIVYNSLYKRYKINSYRFLPKEDFDDAIKWLDRQIAIYRPKLKNVDPEQFRKDMYKSINARANQLSINIYDFAYRALELKKPIVSLKELSDTRLKKLYAKLYSVKQ
jgi:hypothetical protein